MFRNFQQVSRFCLEALDFSKPIGGLSGSEILQSRLAAIEDLKCSKKQGTTRSRDPAQASGQLLQVLFEESASTVIGSPSGQGDLIDAYEVHATTGPSRWFNTY